MKICFSILFSLLLFTACKKSNPDNAKTFTVKGILLESSSNPVPVSFREIKLIRPRETSYSYFGAFFAGSPFTLKSNTDAKGNFQFRYPDKSNIRDLNTLPMYIESIVQSVPGPLVTRSLGITPFVDTNLNVIFLYKKINLLIRSVKFEKALSTGDSIRISTRDRYQRNYNTKVIYGPVQPGTTVLVDTLENYFFTYYRIKENNYECLSNFYVNRREYDTIIPISNQDENIKNIVLSYR